MGRQRPFADVVGPARGLPGGADGPRHRRDRCGIAAPVASTPLPRQWVVGAGALASVVVGIAHPVGVVGGFAIGIGAAAVTHLLLGSPGGRLSLEQMRRVLADLGVEVDDLSYAPLEPRGVSLADATTASGGSLLVKVYGRDAWDGQLLASLWASLWTRGEAPRVGGRLQLVEHEAIVTLSPNERGSPCAHRDRGHGGGP